MEMGRPVKKGQGGMSAQFMGLLVLGVLIVVGGILLSFGALITDNIQDEFTVNTVAYNITVDALDAQAEVGSWMPTLALLGVAIVIIGAVIGILAFRKLG